MDGPDDFEIDYELLALQVRGALKGAGGHHSARGLSIAATNGSNPDLVRNFLGSRQTKPKPEHVAGLASALGVPFVTFLSNWDGPIPRRKSWLLVNAAVEAGVWREHVEWGPEDWFEIAVEPSSRDSEDFGFIVRGRSMDKVLPPGTILRCADPITSGVTFRDEDYVIVERERGGFVELTCKKLCMRPDGAWELRAESHSSEFDDPIFIGRPLDGPDRDQFDAMDEGEIRIKAVVIDAYLPLARRNIRQVT